ncbi:unnamed protein product [Sphagnum tenellum]
MGETDEKPYLNELSLGRFLRERLDPNIVSNVGVPNIAQRFRPDYRSERFKLIFEIDGDQHYRSAKYVIDDKKRDVILTESGYRVVRIPYFVQMTEPVIALLFGGLVSDHSTFKDFPHGFISSSVVFPADFCELGVNRFLDDLAYYSVIRKEIVESLEQAVIVKGDWRLIYPPSVRTFLAP